MNRYPVPPKRPSADDDVPAEVYTGRILHGLMEERRVGAEGTVRTGEYLAVDLAAVSVAGLDERVSGRLELEKLVWEQLRPCGEIVSCLVHDTVDQSYTSSTPGCTSVT
jgi:hypothetical protein